jgi:hypothetical protein
MARCILQPGGGAAEKRPYRSMLVHFERDGEVLYDVWPDVTDGNNEIKNEKFVNGKWIDGKCYDLSGRKVSGDRNSNFKINNSKIQKGIYIQDGKKMVRK